MAMRALSSAAVILVAVLLTSASTASARTVQPKQKAIDPRLSSGGQNKPNVMRDARLQQTSASADGDGFLAPLLPKIRNSVVQIETTSASFDWQRPWQTLTDQQAVGSGFWIQLKGQSVILTNAHVVENVSARSPPLVFTVFLRQSVKVVVRMPALGDEALDAQVVAICNSKDVALVLIKDYEQPRLKGLLSDNQARVVSLLLLTSQPHRRKSSICSWATRTRSSRAPSRSQSAIRWRRRTSSSARAS